MNKLLKIQLLILTLLSSSTDRKDEFNINFSFIKYPSYSVKLPTNLNISRRHTNIQYFVLGDIYGDQELHVDFKDVCTINNNCKINIQIKQDKNCFKYTDLTKDYSGSLVKLEGKELSSGKYFSELIVKIYLQGEEQ